MKELYELYSSYTPEQFFLALSMCAALLFFVFFVSVYAVYFLFNRLANSFEKTNKKTDLKKSITYYCFDKCIYMVCFTDQSLTKPSNHKEN